MIIMRNYFIVEEHEKLKANNAFLLEKTQAEEQYLKEKQIIISEYTHIYSIRWVIMFIVYLDDVETLKTEKEELIMKLKTQVEDQSQNEKQIITG